MSIFDGVKKITVETDSDEPVIIAEITADDDTPIAPAEGYRVRLTPASDGDSKVES
jgi:hypothetical protein